MKMEDYSNKEIYKRFCEDNPDIPLFSQYWWMDSVCKDGDWNILFVRDSENKIIASLPFFLKKKMGFRYVLQPVLTQTNGVWVKYPEKLTAYKKLSLEKQIYNELILQIKQLNLFFFLQNFHFSVTNWLPFYWNGFSQTTRYTYRIPDISNLEKVFSLFSDAKKRHIRKATKTLKVFFDLSPEDFYKHRCRTLLQKGEKNICPEDIFLSFCNAAIRRNQGIILSIEDSMRHIQSALFLVWDKNSAYYLIPSIDSDFRATGASTLMVWEALKYLSGKTKAFDFEGSMSENIENSYRQFGTIQIPYFQLKRSICRLTDFLIFK